MSENTCIFSSEQATQRLPLPEFHSREATETHIKICPKAWTDYLSLPEFMQQELIDF